MGDIEHEWHDGAMLIQFGADGAFRSRLLNNMPGAARPYRGRTEHRVGRNAQGVTFTYAYRSGDVLVMNMPEAGGPVQFQRRRGP
jgi:hypothetical protein